MRSCPYALFQYPISLLFFAVRVRGVFSCADALEKRRAAARKPVLLCLGRAEIRCFHARLYRAGLCLRAAGGEISSRPQARKAFSHALGHLQPRSSGLLQVCGLLPLRLQRAHGTETPAAPCSAAHRHQLLHFSDPQLCGGCLPRRGEGAAEFHRPCRLCRHVPAAYRGAHRALRRHRRAA